MDEATFHGHRRAQLSAVRHAIETAFPGLSLLDNPAFCQPFSSLDPSASPLDDVASASHAESLPPSGSDVGPAPISVGQTVFYKDSTSGCWDRVLIAARDLTDAADPSYTIRLPDGSYRDTTAARLSSSSSAPSPAASRGTSGDPSPNSPMASGFRLTRHTIGMAPQSTLPPSGTPLALISLFSGLHTHASVLSEFFPLTHVASCEIDADARLAGEKHLSALRSLRPDSLPAHIHHLPHDISDVTIASIAASGCLYAPHLLVVNTWMCIHRSAASHTALGAESPHSSAFVSSMQLFLAINAMRLARGCPPAILCTENVPVFSTDRRPLVRDDEALVTGLVGEGVLSDATACGSHAHRVRRQTFSTEPAALIQPILSRVRVPAPGLGTLQSILDPGRTAMPVTFTDTTTAFSRCPVNRIGHPRIAVDTLVSKFFSHAHNGFRGMERGNFVTGPVASLAERRELGGEWAQNVPLDHHELNANERARALGFLVDPTVGFEERTRRRLLGQAADPNQFRVLLMTVMELGDLRQSLLQHMADDSDDDPRWWNDDCAEVSRNLFAATLVAKAGEFLSHSGDSPPAGSGVSVNVTGGAKVKMKSGGRGQAPEQFDWGSLVNPELKELDPANYARLIAGLKDRAMAFAWDLESLGHYNGEAFRMGPFFDRDKHRSISCSPRRYTLPDEAVVRSMVQTNLENGVISPASPSSQFSHPITVAWKKDGATGEREKTRPCSDFRAINAVTELDRYAMANIEEILDKATNAGQNIFTTGDLANGFWQIILDARDRDITTFWGANRDRYHWNRMPFGLKNAPAFFQRIVDTVFEGVCSLYVDDAIVSDKIPDSAEQPWGTDISAHVASVFRVLDRTIAANMTWSAYKFNIGYREVESLGYRVSGTCLQPLVSHTAAIMDMPTPKDKHDIFRFLGLLQHYRKFLGKDLARTTTPLRILTGKVPFTWGPEQEAAFREVKRLVSESPVLRPAQRGEPYVLFTDWSIEGCGAVLCQHFPEPDGAAQLHPVAYASRSNNEAERNYPSYKGEMLSAVWSTEHFRYHLLGVPFVLETDHQPLSYLMKNPNLSGIYARWALRLQEYEFTIKYRPGSQNTVADCLSRNPLPDCDAHWERYHDGLDYFNASVPLPSRSTSAFSIWVSSATVKCSTLNTTQPIHNTTLPSPLRSVRDVWRDPQFLSFLCTGKLPPLLHHNTAAWMQRKARAFRITKDATAPMGIRLYVRHGSMFLESPHPSLRHQLIVQYHRNSLHIGARKTTDLIRLQYSWPGIYGDVEYVVSRCAVCELDRKVFHQTTKNLQPLDIVDPGFRVHVDLAGPFPVSHDGYAYFMIILDAGSKYLTVCPLKDATSNTVTQAFRARWLCVHGAAAIVTTDEGNEFRGSFSAILREALIDHRTTSPSHPQSNGAAEKLVGVIKGMLTRGITDSTSQDKRSWTDHLPYAEMGYNFSVQTTTGFSPYQLLFARRPVFPSEATECFATPVDWDMSATSAHTNVCTSLAKRAALLRRYWPFAEANKRIGQHRQEQGYARRRDGTYVIGTNSWYQPGDFVTTQQYLDKNASPPNLERNAFHAQRVLYVRPAGTLVLQGHDGSILVDNGVHWAPLHARVVSDRYVNHELALERYQSGDDAYQSCPICANADSAENDHYFPDLRRSYDTVVCDWCLTVHHCLCVGLSVRERDALAVWYCPTCRQFSAPPHVVGRSN